MGVQKLTEKFKTEALTPIWQRYAPLVKDQYGYDLAKEGLELRHRVQTDGFWLAKEVLGYKQFSACHKELFDDFFVIKDPGCKDFKTFAEADQGLHDRLLMLSRGGFKSSADIVDCIQWFSCFPDIRINIMTGTGDLAEEFTGIIKDHITLNVDGTIKTWEDGRLKLYQVLFPEHCETKPGLQPEWTTPARRQTVAGPTLRATSLDKNTTGTHCDILKIDDGTTAENTKTADRIKSVNRSISMARRLCEPFGYKDRIGTPYHINDNLVSTLRDEEQRKAKGLDPLVKILIHPAYTVKQGHEHLAPDELKEEMVVLWFPERLTLKYLQTEYADAQKTDVSSFYSQFLLTLSGGNIAKFSRELMVARTVHQVPEDGVTFEAWDLAYSEKEGAKFTVGMAGRFTATGIYIIGMKRGRFSEYELPGVIASFAHQWKPLRVAVEDSMGARWLNSEIRREQTKLRINVPFEYISLGKGTKANNKESKAKLAARLLGDGRLYFWTAMEGLSDLYNELEAFPKGQFTDIVCSLSLLVNHFSNYADTSPALLAPVSERMETARHQLIYGLGPFASKVQDQTLIAVQGAPQEIERDPFADAGLY